MPHPKLTSSLQSMTPPRWEFQSKDSWIRFDNSSSASIEFAYVLDKDNGSITLVIGVDSFKINFSTMKQINQTTKIENSIRRTEEKDSIQFSEKENSSQWVSKVINSSSHLPKHHFNNICGPTKQYPKYGNLKTCWQPDFSTDGNPFLEVAFRKNVIPKRVKIYESTNPGKCIRIYGKDHGKWIQIWGGLKQENPGKSVIREIVFDSVDFATLELRFEFAGGEAYQIDSIQLLGQEKVIVFQKHVFSSWYGKKQFADLTLVSKSGEKIPCHAFILANTFEYFLHSQDIVNVDFDSNIIREILKFAYSGQISIDVTNSKIFIEIAEIWSSPLLKVRCVEFMSTCLTNRTVVDILASSGKNNGVVDSATMKVKCIAFIEKNAKEMMSDSTLLRLDSTGMMTIMKSDNLRVEEIDLYKFLKLWVEERLKQGEKKATLLETTKYIRWSQIDSSTLYHEIKGKTEFMSEDQYLQALEYNLCPSMFSSLVTRLSPYFIDSEILKGSMGTALNNFLPKQNLTHLLLYSHKDGLKASAFHEKCDNKGPTLVVIQSTSGCIFGGYASVGWNVATPNQAGAGSFLFSLVNKNYSHGYQKLPLQGGIQHKTIYSCLNNGPTFGKFDIFLPENFTGQCKFQPGRTFAYPMGVHRQNEYFTGSMIFSVEKIEVYQIK